MNKIAQYQSINVSQKSPSILNIDNEQHLYETKIIKKSDKTIFFADIETDTKTSKTEHIPILMGIVKFKEKKMISKM